MNSKARVLTAFNHETPDRVPIDYLANENIHKEFVRALGLEGQSSQAFLETLGVDFRGAYPNYTGKPLFTPIDGMIVDRVWGFRSNWIDHGSGRYLDICDWPMKDADYEAALNFPVPEPDDYDYDGLLDYVKSVGDYCVFFGGQGLGTVINQLGKLRTMEQALVDIITEDEVGMLIAKKRFDSVYSMTERALDKLRGHIDVLFMGEDLGTQRGPILSPELYRKVVMPFNAKLAGLGRSYGLPVMMHCCGSCSWAFDDFIAMGVTAVDAVQPEAENMSPAFLKKMYGERLSFHGCISTTGALAFGSVADTVADVRQTLDIMMPRGGYCACPTHMIQDNTPVENVTAMYETIRKYGTYR